MAKLIQTKHEGVRYREHPTRKNGVRKDRYYFIRYYLDGKRIEEPLGWETDWKHSHPEKTISLEQEAVSKRAQLLKNQKAGTWPRTLKETKDDNDSKREATAARLKKEAAATKTLSEYWEETYFPAAKLSKKAGSWGKEEQHFRIWIEPILGAMQLRSIRLEQWDELVKMLSTGRSVPLKGRGSKSEAGAKKKEIQVRSIVLSQRSREYITGTLRRILKHSYDRRMVDDPPPTGKRIGIPGPGNNRRLRVISHEEEAKIMDAIQAADLRAWRITRFAFLTGCRVSEAFHMVQANVDQSRRVITFPETKNSDARSLPITSALEELFENMGWREWGAPAAFVFTKEDGTPYREAPSSFKTVVQSLGLNEGRGKRDLITFHSIRHSVATRLAQRLGVRDLMDVMGWRTVVMAMRYVHGDKDAKTRALEMLGVVPEKGKVLAFRGSESQ